MTDQPHAQEIPPDDPLTLPGSGQAPGNRHVTCRACGQPLRDRVSRMWGLGPDCRAKYALRTAPAPPAHEVAQDTLPGL